MKRSTSIINIIIPFYQIQNDLSHKQSLYLFHYYHFIELIINRLEFLTLKLFYVIKKHFKIILKISIYKKYLQTKKKK